MQSLLDGAEQLHNEIKPTDWSAIRELGGAAYFDSSFVDDVRESIQKNAMTPSVARDFVQKFSSERQEFMSNLEGALNSLEKLVPDEETAETKPVARAAFAIPRTLFDNQLGSFTKELKFLNQLLQHVNEAITGEVQPIEVVGLSSSIPTLEIAAGIGTLTAVGKMVNLYLDAWKKVEEIREIRSRLKKAGIAGSAEKELETAITDKIKGVVESSTQLVLENYNKDAERRNELQTAITKDVNRLFAQIERGLTIEIKTNDKPEMDERQETALLELQQVASRLEFPPAAPEPLLLGNGEILEDVADSKQEGGSEHQGKSESRKSGAKTKKTDAQD
jgi:actin-related protein